MVLPTKGILIIKFMTVHNFAGSSIPKWLVPGDGSKNKINLQIYNHKNNLDYILSLHLYS